MEFVDFSLIVPVSNLRTYLLINFEKILCWRETSYQHSQHHTRPQYRLSRAYGLQISLVEHRADSEFFRKCAKKNTKNLPFQRSTYCSQIYICSFAFVLEEPIYISRIWIKMNKLYDMPVLLHSILIM